MAVKPCPFCGSDKGLEFDPKGGSTFRWMRWWCKGCGFGDEVRIGRAYIRLTDDGVETIPVPEDEAIEAAKEAAIREWNTRAP